MIDYAKRLKVVTMIVIILYILFFVWALYFKFGDIDEVRYVSSHTGKMSLKERFLFDIIFVGPFRNQPIGNFNFY